MIPTRLPTSSSVPDLIKAVNAIIGHLEEPLNIVDICESLPRHAKKVYPRRDRSSITRVVIHHVGVDATVGPYNTAGYHVRKGWPGIAYHYFIRASGTVFRTQPLDVISYHCGSKYNDMSVGICLEGSFMEGRKPTPAQIQSLRRLTKHFYPWDVYGHRDLCQTACPGDTWPHWKHLIVA